MASVPRAIWPPTTNDDITFHPFPRLPAELREVIWKLCLPDHVCEIDLPRAEHVYDVNDLKHAPCTLIDTSRLNGCPPVITRVCFESREIALKAGQEALEARKKVQSLPELAMWPYSTWIRNEPDYHEFVPRVIHMNWSHSYDPMWGDMIPELTPVCHLANQPLGSARASIMAEHILFNRFTWTPWRDPYEDSDMETDDEDGNPSPRAYWITDSDQEIVDEFTRISSYLVVVQTVVIHTDFQTGAKTGLFGPLGDAPIQIIDMKEEATVDRYFELATKCESQEAVSPAQDLERRTYKKAKQQLRNLMVVAWSSEEFASMMHPAIMFRLCTYMCNHPTKRRAPEGKVSKMIGPWKE